MKNFVTDAILNDSLKFLELIVDMASRLSLNEGTKKTGGFISVLNPERDLLITRKVDSPFKEKAHKYTRLAIEKAVRLYGNSDRRSFDSLDESKEQFGGGIKYDNLIVAFSGFAPEIDEAISVAYAIHLVEMSNDKFLNNNTSSKTFLQRVIRKMRKFLPENALPSNPCIEELARFLEVHHGV